MGSLSTTCEISLSCSEEGSLSALVSQMRVLGGVIECNLSQNPHFPTTYRRCWLLIGYKLDSGNVALCK